MHGLCGCHCDAAVKGDLNSCSLMTTSWKGAGSPPSTVRAASIPPAQALRSAVSLLAQQGTEASRPGCANLAACMHVGKADRSPLASSICIGEWCRVRRTHACMRAGQEGRDYRDRTDSPMHRATIPLPPYMYPMCRHARFDKRPGHSAADSQ